MIEATLPATESAVPIWPVFVAHVLRVLSAGETLHRRDIVSGAIYSARLSDAVSSTMDFICFLFSDCGKKGAEQLGKRLRRGSS